MASIIMTKEGMGRQNAKCPSRGQKAAPGELGEVVSPEKGFRDVTETKVSKCLFEYMAFNSMRWQCRDSIPLWEKHNSSEFDIHMSSFWLLHYVLYK